MFLNIIQNTLYDSEFWFVFIIGITIYILLYYFLRIGGDFYLVLGAIIVLDVIYLLYVKKYGTPMAPLLNTKTTGLSYKPSTEEIFEKS